MLLALARSDSLPADTLFAPPDFSDFVQVPFEVCYLLLYLELLHLLLVLHHELAVFFSGESFLLELENIYPEHHCIEVRNNIANSLWIH